jgi:TPR repeat protein
VKPFLSTKSSARESTMKAPQAVVIKPATAVKAATPVRSAPAIATAPLKPKPVQTVQGTAPVLAGKPIATAAKAPSAPALPNQTPASTALASACQKGDGNACLSVGQIYAGGVSVARNPKLTLQFYDRSCKLKIAPACLALGTMFEIGTGTKPDLKKAASYYQMACDNGNVIACQMTSGHQIPPSGPQKTSRP